jgi:hypothetical protein
MNDRNERNDRNDRRNGDNDRPKRPQGAGAPRRGADHGRKNERSSAGRSNDRDRPRRDGDRPYDRDRPRRDGDRSYDRDRPRRDGDRPYDRDRPRRDGDRPYDRDRPRRDGDRSFERERPRRDEQRFSDRKPRREGEGRYDRAPRRDGERSFDRDRPRRDGDRSFDRDRPRREGDRTYDRKPRRDGERSFDRDRDRKPRRDGDRPYERRNDDQSRGKNLGRGGTRGGGRSDRGGQQRDFTEAERLQHELRPVRAEHDDPQIPDEITPFDLHPGARNELKTLQPETQEWVARHLAMVGALLDDDPELAHQHAISASRRGGRIPVARETLAITAFHVGDYALSLRELRTYRRLTGSQGHLALMVECERALGRPERGIETGLAANLTKLTTEQRVHLSIAMSGARLDLGQAQQALFELEIPELDPNRAFSWSGELFSAYATVLEDLGRADESALWQQRAVEAEAAIVHRLAAHDEIEVVEVYEHSADRDEHAADRDEHRDDEFARDESDAQAAEASEPDPLPEQLNDDLKDADREQS